MRELILCFTGLGLLSSLTLGRASAQTFEMLDREVEPAFRVGVSETPAVTAARAGSAWKSGWSRTRNVAQLPVVLIDGSAAGKVSEVVWGPGGDVEFVVVRYRHEDHLVPYQAFRPGRIGGMLELTFTPQQFQESPKYLPHRWAEFAARHSPAELRTASDESTTDNRLPEGITDSTSIPSTAGVVQSGGAAVQSSRQPSTSSSVSSGPVGPPSLNLVTGTVASDAALAAPVIGPQPLPLQTEPTEAAPANPQQSVTPPSLNVTTMPLNTGRNLAAGPNDVSRLLFGANAALNRQGLPNQLPPGTTGVGNAAPTLATPNRNIPPNNWNVQNPSPQAVPTVTGAPGYYTGAPGVYVGTPPLATGATPQNQTNANQNGNASSLFAPANPGTAGGATYQGTTNRNSTGVMNPSSAQFPNAGNTGLFPTGGTSGTQIPGKVATPQNSSLSPAYSTVGGVGNASSPGVPGGTGRGTNPAGQPPGTTGGVNPSNRSTVGGVPSAGSQTPGGAPVSPNPSPSAPAPAPGSQGGAAAGPQ